MKKISISIFSCLLYIISQAQEPADALRYSWTVPSGTARTQAVGGAIGALGGDISATYINPAGLGFYRTSDFVFSPIFQFGKTKGTYNGRTETSQRNKLLWGTTGFVLGGGSTSGNVRSAALSIAVNRVADFNSHITYGGTNNLSSYSQRYVEELNNSGVRDSTAAYNFPLGSSLALNTYWIDPVKDASGRVTGFTTNAPVGSGLLQRQTIISKGGINEFALGGAVNVKDKTMIGVTIGIPVLNYERKTTFVEADATENEDNNFNFASVQDSLRTRGVGINLKAGVIFKPQEHLRLGLAIHTPTLFSLTDEYEASITTDSENLAGLWTDYSLDYTNNQPWTTKYNLATPFRAIASAAYVLREVEDVTKQKGFITADLEYVNYKGNSFQTNEDDLYNEELKNYLQDLNRVIDNAYKGSLNVRVGGELKFTTFMVRAGGAYYSNPYQNRNGLRGSRLNLSGGLGYRNQGFFVDLTYVHAVVRDTHFPYRLEDPNRYYGADLRSAIGNVLMTVGFKF